MDERKSVLLRWRDDTEAGVREFGNPAKVYPDGTRYEGKVRKLEVVLLTPSRGSTLMVPASRFENGDGV
ncbi:MAG: hypothetical protein V1664_00410 [Candidatus Uhrbacteria bacterium]